MTRDASRQCFAPCLSDVSSALHLASFLCGFQKQGKQSSHLILHFRESECAQESARARERE